MNRDARVFWGSAALAAAAFAALTPLLLPYGKLGLTAVADRERAWMLTVFCGGVLALLFGASGMLGTTRYLSVRDVHDAGSVKDALHRHVQASRATGDGGPYTRNFGLWVIATGAFLLAIYSVLWITLR